MAAQVGYAQVGRNQLILTFHSQWETPDGTRHFVFIVEPEERSCFETVSFIFSYVCSGCFKRHTILWEAMHRDGEDGKRIRRWVRVFETVKSSDEYDKWAEQGRVLGEHFFGGWLDNPFSRYKIRLENVPESSG